MKKDELQKLRQKSLAELEEKLTELKKRIGKTKLEKEAQKLKNVTELAKLRRDLAQTLTILRMRQLATLQDASNLKEKEESL